MSVKVIHENIISQMSTAVLVLNKQLKIIFANPSAESFCQQSINRLHQQRLMELFSHTTLNEEKLQEALQHNFSYTDNEAVLVFKAGHNLTAELTVTPLFFDNEDNLLLEFRAIDQQKKISQEIQQHNQQTAARNLVRGLAHEIKNPLGGLRGAAQLLEKELKSVELKEFTSIIIEQADRLRNLVDRLLGPNKPPRPAQNNVHELIEKMVRLIELESPRDIEFIRNYDPSIPNLRIDADQFQQTVLNICRNAVNALDGVGKIHFSTRIENQVTIRGKRSRICAAISIKDNGPGIPEAIKDTLFYPMVSGNENGSGLGLSIAQTLIEKHGGKIDVESWPGNTEFTIYLPIEDKE
jgi:two-component system nitrogen regulation sensor histidine kinase GlnL